MTDFIYDIQLLAEDMPAETPAAEESLPAADDLSADGRSADGQSADGQSADGADAHADDLTAHFEALIRGKYKAAFDARVQKILDGRLKNLRRENEQLRANADGQSADGQSADGQSVDGQSVDGQSVDDGLEAAAVSLACLERDAGAIRAVYPDFSWQTELENPAFARLIGAGVDGRTAYEVVHRQEILRRAMAYAARRAADGTARSIASGARPVAENGGRSVSVSRPDPRKLTSDELADIRKRVQNGEKIRF